MLKLLGIDPSFRNFGTAKATYDKNTKQIEITRLQLISPFVVDTRSLRGTRRNSDDLRRAEYLHGHTLDLCKDIDLVIAEVPVGSQSARASVSYGVCIGLLASLPVDLVQVTPIQVKKASVGNPKATKKEMIDWAYSLYPDLDWLTKRGRLLNSNEHLADAIATIHAAIFYKLI